MQKIDLSKYNGRNSQDSELLKEILRDNNLKYHEVLFDDLQNNYWGSFCINCKIEKSKRNDVSNVFVSDGLEWTLSYNKVVNGVFYSDGRPLAIYKG